MVQVFYRFAILDWNSLAYQQTLQRLGKFVYGIFCYGYYYKMYMNVIYNFTKWPNQPKLLFPVTPTGKTLDYVGVF